MPELVHRSTPGSNYRRAFTVLGSVTVKSYCFIFLGLLFVVVSQLQGNSTPKVSALVGNGFLVLKNKPSQEPIRLSYDQAIKEKLPYAFVTSPESFLEVSDLSPLSPYTLRIGQSSGLEISDSEKFFLLKGSILIADRGNNAWFIESNMSQIQIEGSGTFITETTDLGFKLIVLEGTFQSNAPGISNTLSSGDLVLVSGPQGEISQVIQIELPLLLSTSRLVNFFPHDLSTHSRLLSAAQVQVMRMKTKYDAFIGGVSDDRKLRIWKVGSRKN